MNMQWRDNSRVLSQSGDRVRRTPSSASDPLVALACLLLILSMTVSGGNGPPAPLRFPVAISEVMMGSGVNEGDAVAAMQTWSNLTAKRWGIFFEFRVSRFANLVREIHEHQIEGYMLTTLEFLAVENYSSREIMADESNARGGDDYLLLVHEDSSFRTVTDLHGKSLNVYDNPRMCLASMWLDILLASSKCGLPLEHFTRVALQNKLSRAVLPVYFRQIDACLVTRRGFKMMCELNPQLGRKLRVVAASPLLITTIIAFHKDCPAERRRKYESAMLDLQKTPTGQQTLTLFESSPVIPMDTSALRSVRELAREHDRIRKK